MYNYTVEADGAAYVDVRVCELQIQYGNMPSGLDSGFHIDGLYIVLRCGDEVRRTNCLWPSSSCSHASALKEHLTDVLMTGAEEENDNDWIWNELFRFVLPPESQSAETASTSTSQEQRMSAVTSGAAAGSSSSAMTPPLTPAPTGNTRDGPSSAVLPMSTAATAAAGGAQGSFLYNPSVPDSTSTSPTGGFNAPQQQQAVKSSPSAKASSSPFLYPAIDLELWRSTPSAENCLSRYTYHVPLELLHGGYGLHQLDVVAERVVPLRMKEPSSIMGNLYGWSGHRLNLRLRVQAVGLAPVTAEWTLPADAMSSMSAGAAGGYALPYSLTGSDHASRSTAFNGGYASTMGSLNPVLANLLAPLGVSTMSGPGLVGRSVNGVLGGGNTTPVLPPVFPLSAAPSTSGAVLSDLTGSSVLPASGGQGVLGDGSPVWRGAVLPAVFPQFPAAVPLQQQQRQK